MLGMMTEEDERQLKRYAQWRNMISPMDISRFWVPTILISLELYLSTSSREDPLTAIKMNSKTKYIDDDKKFALKIQEDPGTHPRLHVYAIHEDFLTPTKYNDKKYALKVCNLIYCCHSHRGRRHWRRSKLQINFWYWGGGEKYSIIHSVSGANRGIRMHSHVFLCTS